MTQHRRWISAVLGAGPEAVLSHRSAAALWRLTDRDREPVRVTARRPTASRHARIRVTCRPGLKDEQVTAHESIPVTTPVRTLVDLSTEVGGLSLERAINEADKTDLIDPSALTLALKDYGGERGVRQLRELLERHAFRLSDANLEIMFRTISIEAGLPLPETKVFVDGFEVDFFWPGLGLIVETDGLRYHRTPSSQARDRLRDQRHTAAGRTCLRFTHWQVANEAKRVQEVVQRTAARLDPSGPRSTPPQ
jgi:very-short-patch-repair endonuclease